MDNMSPFSTDQWIQQYPNTPMARSGGEPSEPTTIVPVYRDSSQGTSGQGPKPIRRRSRASRRTPTTVLNASPTDFRALVQRFTGCSSNNETGSASASSLVGISARGPVNIDFARNDVNESSSRFTYYDNNNQQMQSVSGLSEFQAGYGMNNASVAYESIDESPVIGNRIDGGSRGYNNV